MFDVLRGHALVVLVERPEYEFAHAVLCLGVCDPLSGNDQTRSRRTTMGALESFADRIHRLRVARGLSERELAERIGMTVHQYQSVVRAGSNPTCRLLVELVEALDVPLTELTEPTIEALPTFEQLRALFWELRWRRATMMEQAGQVTSVDRRLARLRQALAADTELEAHSLENVGALMSSIERNDTLRAWTRRYAQLVLQRCKSNKRQACQVLGISYHTLQTYLRDPLDPDRHSVAKASSNGESIESVSNNARSTASVQ